jgi:hypothetical protein
VGTVLGAVLARDLLQVLVVAGGVLTVLAAFGLAGSRPLRPLLAAGALAALGLAGGAAYVWSWMTNYYHGSPANHVVSVAVIGSALAAALVSWRVVARSAAVSQR